MKYNGKNVLSLCLFTDLALHSSITKFVHIRVFTKTCISPYTFSKTSLFTPDFYFFNINLHKPALICHSELL